MESSYKYPDKGERGIKLNHKHIFNNKGRGNKKNVLVITNTYIYDGLKRSYIKAKELEQNAITKKHKRNKEVESNYINVDRRGEELERNYNYSYKKVSGDKMSMARTFLLY